MPVLTLPTLAAALWIGILAEAARDGPPTTGGAATLLGIGLIGAAGALALRRHRAAADAVPGPRQAARWLVPGLACGVLFGSFVSLGAGWATLREARVRTSPLAAAAGHAVTVVGSVQERPHPGQFGWTASIAAGVLSPRIDTGTTGGLGLGLRLADPLWVEGRGDPPKLAEGDRVAAVGLLSLPEGDFGTWLRHRGYPAVLAADRVWRLGPTTDPLRRAAGIVRGALSRSVRRMFSSRDGGLVMGLALGDTSRLDPGIEEDFKASGLSHLTAVSGENLAMFLAPILGLVGLSRLGRRSRLIIGAAAVAFFVLLTGAEPSVLRAAAMAGLTMLGVFLGRPRSPPAILGGAVLLLLANNPTLVWSIGFQLSVMATAGMALMAQPLSERLRFLPRSLALAAATTLAAQAGVAPLLLYHFGLVPLVSIPANLLAFPAVAPAMLLGLLAAAVGPAVPILGGGLAVLAALPLHYLEGLAHRMAHSPVATVTSPVGRPGQLALGIGLILWIGWWIRGGARVPRRVLVVAALALPAFLWVGGIRAGPPSWPTVVFFDVGQGDAALVRSPAGAAILIDGGPDPELVARKLAELGIHRLDMVVATHPHQDHVGGLPVVLVRYPVGLVLDPGCRGDSPAYADFLRAVAAAGAPLRHPRPGAMFVVGDVRVEVLGPMHCFAGTNSDPNNDSLVLRVLMGGASVLFPGDAELSAQTDLLQAEASNLSAPVLKVPHHGGDTSMSGFFVAVHARIAVVSVGPNRYGHPSPKVLHELRADGMRVYRTDRAGDVTVVFGAGRLLVDTGG